MLKIKAATTKLKLNQTEHLKNSFAKTDKPIPKLGFLPHPAAYIT